MFRQGPTDEQLQHPTVTGPRSLDLQTLLSHRKPFGLECIDIGRHGHSVVQQRAYLGQVAVQQDDRLVGLPESFLQQQDAEVQVVHPLLHGIKADLRLPPARIGIGLDDLSGGMGRPAIPKRLG